MAEKYGTVPPKFTKAWWEYFWMYYKWHTITIIFLIICSLITVHEISNSEKYDLRLAYAGNHIFSAELKAAVIEELVPLCSDVDGNKKTELAFQQFSLTSSDVSYQTAMLMKFTLALSADDTYLYIIDKDVANSQMGESPEESCFLPTDEWASSLPSEEHLFCKYDNSYGIELTEIDAFSKIAENTGADFSGKYLFVRYYPRKDQKNQIEGHAAAIELAKKLTE